MQNSNYKKINEKTHLIITSGDRETLNIKVLYSCGGSWFESKTDAGKKHLLEHCIVARTMDMNHDQFKDWERKNSIIINAYTSPLRMALTATGHKSDFVLMLDTLCQCAFNPAFDQSDLDREKAIVLREIAERRGDPNYKLYFDTINQVFLPNSYQTHETLGNPEMVAQTTLEDFQRLNAEGVSQSNMMICIDGGGIDPELAEQIILKNQNTFKNNINITQLAIDYSPESLYQEFKIKSVVHDLAHEHCDVTFILPIDINLENSPARTVYNNLYLQYGGILYDRLRDEKMLVYGISPSFDLETQSLQINLTCEEKYIDQIILETEDILSNFDKYFNDEKLVDYLKVVYKKQAMGSDNLNSTNSFISNTMLNYNQFLTQYEYIERIKKVNKDDIKTLSDGILNGWENKKVVIVSKDKSIEKYNVD